MLAEGDDGPLIPSMAVAAIVRNEIGGRRPAAGARPATGELELADYDAIFRPYAIRHAIRDDGALAGAPLYQRMLAGAWDDLPASLRAMHQVDVVQVARGEADIERGAGLLAGLVASCFGFPRAARGAPTSVRFEVTDGAETWTRRFSGASDSMLQSARRWSGRSCVIAAGLSRNKARLRAAPTSSRPRDQTPGPCVCFRAATIVSAGRPDNSAR
jgi:hypothetical protein